VVKCLFDVSIYGVLCLFLCIVIDSMFGFMY
jgi:hypothetical protein